MREKQMQARYWREGKREREWYSDAIVDYFRKEDEQGKWTKPNTRGG